MPAKVKVRVHAGRNLPVMDRGNDTTDAYVEVKLGSITHKTDVCRKSLNPQWNSEWFLFEVDELELQDETLQIRLMDHDTYSANDAIGKVYIDLNPLLLPAVLTCPCMNEGSNTYAAVARSAGGPSMSGWFPVFDTMHGGRGEVKVTVKVDLFSDLNKYRQSSCGIQFFRTPAVPEGYVSRGIHGFVEELIVNDDPEYQWIDKIRTPRASNEARQALFYKLAGEVQRKIGLKAMEMGGNAVIGYRLCFDFEGESGIVVRGIGTAVTLILLQPELHLPSHPSPLPSVSEQIAHRESPLPEEFADKTGSPSSHTPTKLSQSPAKVGAMPCVHRRASDSDLTSSLAGSGGSSGGLPTAAAYTRHIVGQDSMDMNEYPFITVTKFPPGFIKYIGGRVTCSAVKVLERAAISEDQEVRDSWWNQVRKEVRSHLRAFGCNVALGYSEHTSICEDVCLLSASGTAAVINVQADLELLSRPNVCRLCRRELPDKKDSERERHHSAKSDVGATAPHYFKSQHRDGAETSLSCTVCHLPYLRSIIPGEIGPTPCQMCTKEQVPEYFQATIDPPPGLPVVGKGGLFQVEVLRKKKPDLKGEILAKEVSDIMPFLEFELQQAVNIKLKMRGMNSLFGLKTQISIGEKYIFATMTGTAFFCQALESPGKPLIIKNGEKTSESTKAQAEIQKRLEDAFEANLEYYDLTSTKSPAVPQNLDVDDIRDGLAEMDLLAGNKNCWIAELDDIDEMNCKDSLDERPPPCDFSIVNTETVIGVDVGIPSSMQMFTNMWRHKVAAMKTPYLSSVMQFLRLKFRKTTPCVLAKLEFCTSLPEPDELQVTVTGFAMGLGQPSKPDDEPSLGACAVPPKNNSRDDDMIFELDDDQLMDVKPKSRVAKPDTPKLRNLSGTQQFGIEITPLSYIPGGYIRQYIGNLNFFFIRESTSIKDTKESGGLNDFMHCFTTEVLGIVRAHVAALNGNAMVSFSMSECVLHHNLNKNQGQCLINVGGDVVNVSYVDRIPEE